MQNTLEKIKHHWELYQQCRGEMLELYNTRLEEMRQMKHELNLASRSLLDQQLEEPPIPETINVDEQMSVLKDTMATLGTVADVVELMDEEDVVEIPGSHKKRNCHRKQGCQDGNQGSFQGSGITTKGGPVAPENQERQGQSREVDAEDLNFGSWRPDRLANSLSRGDGIEDPPPVWFPQAANQDSGSHCVYVSPSREYAFCGTLEAGHAGFLVLSAVASLMGSRW